MRVTANAIPGSSSVAHAALDRGQHATRFGIRAKLLAGYAVVLVLTLVLGVLAINSLSSMNALGGRVYDDHLQPIRDLAQIRSQFEMVDSQALRSIAGQTGGSAAGSSTDAQRAVAQIDQSVASYRQNYPLTDEEKQGITAFQTDWNQYQPIFRQVLLTAGAGDLSGAARLYDEQAAPLYQKIDADLARQIATSDTLAKQVDNHIQSTYDQTRTEAILLILIAMAVGGIVAYWLSRSISNTVTQMTAASAGLAVGDLNQRIDVRSSDELGQMANAFRTMMAYQSRMADVADAIARGDLSQEIQPQSANDILGVAFQRMTVNLRRIVSELQQGSHDLSSSSTEILAAVSQQSAGATEQSAAIAQTTATVDEVKASAEQTSQSADRLSRGAQQASDGASAGVSAIRDATDGVADIRRHVHSIAENILVLSEQSQQIGEIITTVNDLADQSNLLALNAAIEANRAGEQGKGFIVVANEIRALAERSKAATAQVRTILSDIQRATNAAAMATEQGTKGADIGSQLIDKAGGVIDQLSDVIHETAETAQQIAASMRQHSVGMEQIAVAMASIDQATGQNLAATENTKQAAQNLTDLAGRLTQMTAQYQL